MDSSASRPDPFVTALSVFRSRWDAPVLGACLAGVRRFDDYQRTLGVSRKTLAERLKYLVSEGLLFRECYQTRPQRYEYRVTDKGLELLPAFQLMAAWADRWGTGPVS
ncbi:transcriptional regulator [Nocardioides marmoriginsengisoli]|uniref:Transcriptional regulator n=1 Tax=Nocardioides marmoriginsengisoli TaxID=661483 RepID=A0A3N0CH06_9ACTN|nr:helix-turn-helix domain-containing protein [Nocardioides marmoriginsengisoli]RNL62745.1 transcriptional regulator [Nocardioides marmoriginsengisoli]